MDRIHANVYVYARSDRAFQSCERGREVFVYSAPCVRERAACIACVLGGKKHRSCICMPVQCNGPDSQMPVLQRVWPYTAEFQDVRATAVHTMLKMCVNRTTGPKLVELGAVELVEKTTKAYSGRLVQRCASLQQVLRGDPGVPTMQAAHTDGVDSV